MSKKYYVVYWAPTQMGCIIHEGEHPLNDFVRSDLVKKIADKINRANVLNGIYVPQEAICITNVIELPVGSFNSSIINTTLSP